MAFAMNGACEPDTGNIRPKNSFLKIESLRAELRVADPQGGCADFYFYARQNRKERDIEERYYDLRLVPPLRCNMLFVNGCAMTLTH